VTVQHDEPAPAAPPAPPERAGEGPGPLARLRDAAFPQAPELPRPPWRWAAWLAFLVGAALYQAFRTPGVGAFDTVWAEDGANFLNDAVNDGPIEAITRSVNGYFHLYPRLLAEITTLFPVSWWAVVNTSLAIASTCAMAAIVYQASAAHLRRPVLRLLVAAPVALQWVANGEAVNSVATLQFCSLYTAFWLLVYVPKGRLGRIGGPIVVATAALSTILALALVPLALLRVALRRDRNSLWLAAAVVGAVLVQGLGLATGQASRSGIGETRLDPAWVVNRYRIIQVPTTFLGEKVVPTLDRNPELVLLGWAVLLAALAFAFWKALRPAWVLAGLAFALSVGLFAEEIVAMGKVPYRYLVAPAALLVTAAVALLRPRDAAPPGDGDPAGRPRLVAYAPVAALLVLLVSVALVNYRVPHKTRTPFTPSWTAQVSQRAAECRADPGLASVIVLSGPERMPYGKVNVPCGRLR